MAGKASVTPMTLPAPHNSRFWFYLVVSLIGLITAMVFNGIASVEGADYLSAWFGSPVDWVLSLDLLVVALAGSAFIILEGRRLGMKRLWLYIVASGVTAFAFTFPLFLAMRERALAQQKKNSGSS